eukprot:scaffold10283_cov31-Tisochrysis_lutea.AAC.4
MPRTRWPRLVARDTSAGVGLGVKRDAAHKQFAVPCGARPRRPEATSAPYSRGTISSSEFSLSFASAHATCDNSSGLASGRSLRMSDGNDVSRDKGIVAPRRPRPHKRLAASCGVKPLFEESEMSPAAVSSSGARDGDGAHPIVAMACTVAAMARASSTSVLIPEASPRMAAWQEWREVLFRVLMALKSTPRAQAVLETHLASSLCASLSVALQSRLMGTSDSSTMLGLVPLSALDC